MKKNTHALIASASASDVVKLAKRKKHYYC